jgi:hypothetical protein
VSRESSCIDPVSWACLGAGAGSGARAAGCGVGSGAFLAGFTLHASSSKPVAGLDGAEAAAAWGAAAVGDDVLPSESVCDENALGSTTLLVSTGGAGRPFLVLFRSVPPGPENRPPSLSSAPLTFLVRPYLVSRNLITLMISPSRRPRFRRTLASTSGRTLSSIESLEKAWAYLSHSPT